MVSEIDLTLDEGLFLPVGALNAMRRDAVAALLATLAKGEENAFSTVAPLSTELPTAKPLHTATVYRADTYAALDTDSFDITFLAFDQTALPFRPFSLTARRSAFVPPFVPLPPAV